MGHPGWMAYSCSWLGGMQLGLGWARRDRRRTQLDSGEAKRGADV